MNTESRTTHEQAPASRDAAFTRLDLLLVVGVIVLLGLLRLSAATGLKNQSKLANCAANLRQLCLAMLEYGNENSDTLPTQGTGGSWLWDLDWNVGNRLSTYGARQEVWYCPGTAPRFGPADNLILYNLSPGRFHVVGYAPTLPGTATLQPTNVNSTITPQPIQLSGLVMPPLASQRVLLADANLDMNGNFVSIFGGYKRAGIYVPHVCPHLNGNIPAGGNLGMLDGHVEWRSFDQMQVRTVSTSAPRFWW